MKLKLSEIIELNYEVNGASRNVDGVQEVLMHGLMKQKSSLKIKAYLQRLNKIISEEIKIYEDLKKELYLKYGKENEDGSISLLPENIAEFQKEHDELINAEREIDVKMIWSTDLTLDNLAAIETDEVYNVFLKLVDN